MVKFLILSLKSSMFLSPFSLWLYYSKYQNIYNDII
nr:MAG TPA: hypothetical protein [Caudoviricetes sp.]